MWLIMEIKIRNFCLGSCMLEENTFKIGVLSLRNPHADIVVLHNLSGKVGDKILCYKST